MLQFFTNPNRSIKPQSRVSAVASLKACKLVKAKGVKRPAFAPVCG